MIPPQPIVPGRQTRPAAQKVAPPTPSLLGRMGFGRRAADEPPAATEMPEERVTVAKMRQVAPSLGRIDPADRPAPPSSDRDQDLQIPPFLYKVSN